MRKALFSCVVLLFAVGARAQTQNAPEILGKVAAVYAGCSSYYDDATVITVPIIGGQSGGQSQFQIRTTFVRPRSFRIILLPLNRQGRDRDIAWIVWKNGEEIASWPPTGRTNREGPFEASLARMSPMSGGSSLLVPPLLLPNIFRNSDLLALIIDPKVMGEEKVDGRLTFRIEGTLAGLPIKLWIDRTDYLILKTSLRIGFGSRQIESTIQYKPKLNSEIRPDDLAFKPPRNMTPQAAEIAAPISSPTTPPVLAPRLRAFGSSLTRNRPEEAINSSNRASGDDDVVRIDTDLVVSAVLVVDPQGKIVNGLTAKDFVVKEDNNLQEVASFSLGDSKDSPRSIVLIIDYSASQLPYIRTSIEAAKTLVDKLNPKDRMALVTDDVKLLADFTSDKELLKAKLESLKSRALSGEVGASIQYDALMATLNELFNNEDVRPIIIFQTDGDQLESLKGGTLMNVFAPPRKYGLQDVLNATERVHATVYSVISGVKFAGVPETELTNRARMDWVNRQAASVELRRVRNLPAPPTRVAEGPGDEVLQRLASQWLRRHAALEAVAKFTGAWAEFLEQPDQADEIYTRVLSDIDRRYVVGYYPTNRLRDGKRRKVSIEVRDHPEYQVWGQKAYFARKEQ